MGRHNGILQKGKPYSCKAAGLGIYVKESGFLLYQAVFVWTFFSPHNFLSN